MAKDQTEVGGQTYSKDVTPGYNPRTKTFEEFMAICYESPKYGIIIGRFLNCPTRPSETPLGVL